LGITIIEHRLDFLAPVEARLSETSDRHAFGKLKRHEFGRESPVAKRHDGSGLVMSPIHRADSIAAPARRLREYQALDLHGADPAKVAAQVTALVGQLQMEKQQSQAIAAIALIGLVALVVLAGK
jgi:hypothetical protein